jgi:hypothetical protein
MYRTGNPAITGDLGKGHGGHGGHHHGGGFSWGGRRGGIYESSFVFPYDVCFTNCVERGIPVSACRTRCSYYSGSLGADAGDAVGGFVSAILPVAVIAGAAWLFFRKKRT